MYEVTGEGLTLLDTVETGEIFACPSVDGYTKQVYTPGGFYQKVLVFMWEDIGLVTHSTLKCLGKCHSVGVLSPHTLCACDSSSGSVKVVRVTDDTVTDTLRKPAEVADKKPVYTAVLGSSILVWYEPYNLVLYENGVASPGTMVAWPAGMKSVNSMSSDGVSRFLVCDCQSKAVFILDENGKLCDKVNINTTSMVWDCTVGDGKLWVGCANGDIVVMSPQ